MRDSGSFSQGRSGIPSIVGESWPRHAVRHLPLVLVLLVSALLQAQQPAITSIVNAASYEARGVVPGGIMTLFGMNIVSASGIVSAAAVPLPTMLGGTQVLVNNIPAPLFAVANVNRQEQINFQVPWEVAGANTVTVVVVNGNGRSGGPYEPQGYVVSAAHPGLFTLDGRSAIVVHGATNQLVTVSNPAEPGEVVVFYATGLGAVDRAQQSGQPASLTEFARTTYTPIVNIGGWGTVATAVHFAGLTPGSVGLYQINCTIPAIGSGEPFVALTMLDRRLGGQTEYSSRIVYIPVRGRTTAVPFGMEFVQIQPGEFTMGCSPGDGECQSDEAPVHRVRITRGFQIGKYEVTREQWQAAPDSKPSPPIEGASRPIDSVSWEDVQGFLRRLNTRYDGYRYRLPTEAEWEYAARAGTSDKYGGGGPLGDVAWYGNNSGSQTHPVGQKRPNAWGLYDMLGNVREWCQDWYGLSYYSGSPQADPAGPASGQRRVFRGGSFYGTAGDARVSYRSGIGLESQGSNVGFRCVREVIP